MIWLRRNGRVLFDSCVVSILSYSLFGFSWTYAGVYLGWILVSTILHGVTPPEDALR